MTSTSQFEGFVNHALVETSPSLNDTNAVITAVVHMMHVEQLLRN